MSAPTAHQPQAPLPLQGREAAKLHMLATVLRAHEPAVHSVWGNPDINDLDDLFRAARAALRGLFPRRVIVWITDETVARAAAAAIQAPYLFGTGYGAIAMAPVRINCVTPPAPYGVNQATAPNTSPRLAVVPSEHGRHVGPRGGTR